MGEINDQLEHANAWSVVVTGLLMGLVHVLTGPDHLSALIVLSAGSSWRSAVLGMRWGVGHSTGLIVVTAVFLALDQHLNIDKMGSYCDFVVGILMMVLGMWGISYYWRVRKATVAKEAEAQQGMQVDHPVTPALNAATPTYGAFQSMDIEAQSSKGSQSEIPAVNRDSEALLVVHHHHGCFGLSHDHAPDIKNPRTQRITAFAYGLAHGLAGTGGVLGVLPAVVLNDWAKSSAYLGSFCISSILTMGSFAAIYGEVTGRIVRLSDRLTYRVGFFSAGVSLIVGILWLILVSTGQLDAVFG